MSSINPYYTHHYSQPEDYKFSHDSVFLARYVFEHVKSQPIPSWSVLDLCSGCGIIGFDFAFHCKHELGKYPSRIDFLEIQDIYKEHFLKNLKMFDGLNGQLLLKNYKDLVTQNTTEEYDLIISNPPYFLVEHGNLSPSEFKNRCRFFIDSDLETLIHAIEHRLKPNGKAFALIKESQSHNYYPIKSLAKIFSKKMNIRVCGEIRGTAVVAIDKNI